MVATATSSDGGEDRRWEMENGREIVGRMDYETTDYGTADET